MSRQIGVFYLIDDDKSPVPLCETHFFVSFDGPAGDMDKYLRNHLKRLRYRGWWLMHDGKIAAKSEHCNFRRMISEARARLSQTYGEPPSVGKQQDGQSATEKESEHE